MAGTVNTKEIHDGKFLWLLWEKPPANSPFVSSGNVNIIARCRSRFGIDGDKPDSTWPNYGYNNFFYSESNAVKVGKRLADWFAYQGLTRDKGQITVGGVPHAGAIFVQDWATPNYTGKDPQGNTGPSLFYETGDSVSDVLTTSDFAGYTNATSIVASRSNLKHFVGFMANAISKSTTNTVMTDSAGATHNIMGVANWITSVLQSMKSECDSRNLCYPRYLAFDIEGFHPSAYLFTGYSSKPSGATASSAVAGQFPPLFRSAPLRAVQADARYATETVYQEWSGNGWVNKTWQDAWNAAGGPTGNPDQFFANGNNVDFARRFTPYMTKMADYALHKMLYEPAKSVFQGILCGNYNVYFPTTASAPEFEGSNSWLRYPVSDFENKRHLRADWQSPVLYSPNMNNAFYRYSPERYNPTYETQFLSSPLTVTGHPFGSTKETIYRNFIKGSTRSATTRNPLPLLPWYELPGTNIGSELFAVHASTTADVLDVMKSAYDSGVRVFQVFNQNHATLSQSTIDNSVTLFNSLKSYINEQNTSQLLIVTEDGSGGQTGATINSPFVPRVRYVGPVVGEINQTPDKDSISAPASE